MDGFISGMESRRGSVMATAQSIANSAASAIRSALQIHSPSRGGRKNLHVGCQWVWLKV